MYFIDKDRDERLYTELLEVGVFTNADYTGFTLPPEGRLMDALRDNAEKIDESRWIHWLVSKHGYTRLAGIPADRFFLEELRFDSEDIQQSMTADVYPISKHGNRLLLGCARPIGSSEWLNALYKRAHVGGAVWLAISLRESINLRRNLRDLVMLS